MSLPIKSTLNLTISTEGLKDTLSFNDTIWISLNIPKFVEGAYSEQNLELIGNLFGEFALSLCSINSLTISPETGDFNFINDIGEITTLSSNNYPSIDFKDCNNSSKIRFGIIPKVQGSYLVSFGVLLSEPNLSLKRVGTDCSRVISDFIFTTNSTSENNNYYILEAEAVPEYLPPNLTEEDFHRAGIFAFVVKE